jgi:hypothetical protein
MAGSQEVVLKLTEEQREQISTVAGKNVSSVLLIEICYDEFGPISGDHASRQTQSTTIS